MLRDFRSMPIRQGYTIVATAVMFTAVVHPCAGQLSPGRLVERVSSVADPSQTYALYLPPGYVPDRRWPVLFVLDPRGRYSP